MNIFEAVKQSVTTRQAAESYGIRVNKNGMAVCPFHRDKNPSMKVDRRFHCFGCQADGDVIDFTAHLYNLKPKEAAEKLARDFSIHYENMGHSPPQRKQIKRQLTQEQRYLQAEFPCTGRLPAFVETVERRVCSETGGRCLASAVYGGIGKNIRNRVPVGYIIIRHIRRTSCRSGGSWEGGDSD